MGQRLSPSEVEFYREHGYLALPKAIPDEDVEVLRRETTEIFRGKYAVEGIVPLSESATEDECLREYLCIHQPHKLSAVMEGFLAHPGIVGALSGLIGPNVKCMQSMLFVKPPGFPGQAWHQDERYIPTEDRSLTGAWVAIDDATVENGCLWVVPGSHRDALHETGSQPDNDEYDGIGEIALDVPTGRAIPLEIEKGGVLFFNGFLLHESRRNRSTRYRRSLVNHYMSGESRLSWCGYDDFPDVKIVLGVDPHPERGFADLSKPWLRPAGAVRHQ